MRAQFIFVAALLFVVASASPATTEKPSSNKTISICPIELTALGKTGRWHFNFTYSVITDANGTVSKVADLRANKGAAAINEAALIECVKTWKLLPHGQHVVLFSLGTTSDENYISITDPNRDIVKLVLP